MPAAARSAPYTLAATVVSFVLPSYMSTLTVEVGLLASHAQPYIPVQLAPLRYPLYEVDAKEDNARSMMALLVPTPPPAPPPSPQEARDIPRAARIAKAKDSLPY